MELTDAATDMGMPASGTSSDRPIRVLHVYKTYYPDTTGGVEVVLQQLMRSLRLLGVESRLFVLSPRAEPRCIERPEGTVVRSPTTLSMASNPMSFAAHGEFKRQLGWANVVHYQFPWPYGDLMHLLHGRRKPSVVSYQSDVVRQKSLMMLYRPLMRKFLSNVGKVCATSPQYVTTSPVLSNLARQIDIIPNGIDADACPPAPLPVLQRWKDALGQGFFLFVGVLRYYKGLHSLIDAAAGLSADVVIAGAGPEEQALRAQARALNATNVRFLGHVSDEDKAALLELCGAFVFPSHLRSEAFGMSLVEASMFAKPMVSCEIGTGTTYVNLQGVTGLSVPPESPDALRNAMQALQADPERSKRMGQAARERYESLFTGQRMAQSYSQLYRSLLPS